MEQLVDSSHGPTALLTSLVALLALHLIWKIIEVVKEWAQKKGEHTDQNRVDIIKLEYHFKELNGKLDKLLKIDADVRRAFVGLRLLSGEKWPDIRREIMQEDIGGRRD